MIFKEIEFEIKDLVFWCGVDLTGWALPLHVNWSNHAQLFFCSISFLCFRFSIEHWKLDDISDETTVEEVENGN